MGIHRRLAIVVCGIGGLLALAASFGWGESGVDQTNAALVIVSLAAASIGALQLLALRLDVRWPQATLAQAVGRLVVPTFVAVVATLLVADRGIFSGDERYYVRLVGVLAVAAGAVYGAHRLVPVGRLGRSPLSNPTQVSTGTDQTQRYRPPHMAAPSAVVAPRRTIAHRVASGLIALFWVPLGLLVWFASVYCAKHSGAAFAVAVAYVGAQLIGNVVAGVALDRRCSAGGLLLALGRSFSVAAGLVFAGLPLWLLRGGSGSCS